MPRIGFLMEQTLGHVTFHANLERVVRLHPEIEPVWLPVPFNANDRFETAPLVRSNWTLKGSLRARALLKRAGKLDRLMIHTPTIGLFALPWIRSIPTLISLDATPINIDSVGEGYDHRRGTEPTERLKRLLTGRVFRSADLLVCWSSWAAKSLQADYGVDAGRVSVVPPGVDVERMRTPVRQWDGQRPLRLLFVGGDFRRKGGRQLLEAFSIPEISRRCTLDIVTRAPELKINTEGVTVHQDLPVNGEALSNLYRRSDLFVLPTIADCLPLALLEAMAAGLPVISTCVGAIPEAVSDGVNGVLVASADTEAIVAALRRFIDDPMLIERCSLQSEAIAMKQYSASINCGTILASLALQGNG